MWTKLIPIWTFSVSWSCVLNIELRCLKKSIFSPSWQLKHLRLERVISYHMKRFMRCKKSLLVYSTTMNKRTFSGYTCVKLKYMGIIIWIFTNNVTWSLWTHRCYESSDSLTSGLRHICRSNYVPLKWFTRVRQPFYNNFSKYFHCILLWVKRESYFTNNKNSFLFCRLFASEYSQCQISRYWQPNV